MYLIAAELSVTNLLLKSFPLWMVPAILIWGISSICLLLQLLSAPLKDLVILMFSVGQEQVGNSTRRMQIIFIIT